MDESCDTILDRVAKSRERLDADLQQLKSAGPVEPKLRKAYGYWGSYPLQKELLVDSNKLESSDEVERSKLYDLQYKLDAVHKEATAVLMKRAEEMGLDSASIWQSAAYCRDLLAREPRKHYPADRDDDMWPGCLGQSLYKLPQDIRQAIQDGHAQVMRLSIKGTAESRIDDEALLSATRLAELSGADPEPLRKRLDRYRKVNKNGCVENTERGPHDPQYLYRYGAVKHLLRNK